MVMTCVWPFGICKVYEHDGGVLIKIRFTDTADMRNNFGSQMTVKLWYDLTEGMTVVVYTLT